MINEIKEEFDATVREVNITWVELVDNGKYTNVRDFRKALQALKVLTQKLRVQSNLDYKERIR